MTLNRNIKMLIFFPGADKSSPAPAATSAANCVECDQTAGAASHGRPIPDRQPTLPPPRRSVTSLTESHHLTLYGCIMNLNFRLFVVSTCTCETLIFKSHRPYKSKGFRYSFKQLIFLVNITFSEVKATPYY